MSSNWFYLSLMTLGYIFGEIAHFLINTSSKAVAKDVGFGNQACQVLDNVTLEANDTTCKDAIDDKDKCLQHAEKCTWDYNGSGIEYQVLAGPAFIAVFTFANLFTGLTSDRIAGYSKYIGRHTLMAFGVMLFSVSLFLMGLANSYWQLVLLRMGIAAGKSAVCCEFSSAVCFEFLSAVCFEF